MQTTFPDGGQVCFYVTNLFFRQYLHSCVLSFCLALTLKPSKWRLLFDNDLENGVLKKGQPAQQAFSLELLREIWSESIVNELARKRMLRRLNKAGVSCVFHWVRSHFTKWCFVHTLGTQVVFHPLCSVSRRHFCKRSVARSYGSTQSSTENTCTQGPGFHFSTRVQGLDLLFCCTLVQRNQE